MLESLFNIVTGFQVCNFIKKRLQHRCFLVKFATFFRTFFLHRTLPGDCFWNHLHQRNPLKYWLTRKHIITQVISSIIRRRRCRCSSKSVLKNFANFTGKQPCWSLWNLCCFPVKFTKFLKIIFFPSTSCGCFCNMWNSRLFNYNSNDWIIQFWILPWLSRIEVNHLRNASLSDSLNSPNLLSLAKKQSISIPSIIFGINIFYN